MFADQEKSGMWKKKQCNSDVNHKVSDLLMFKMGTKLNMYQKRDQTIL